MKFGSEERYNLIRINQSPQTKQRFELGFFENRLKKTYFKPFTNL